MIAVGQTIGNYTLTAKLGEGGMGVVYLAEHPVIGRKVAMKAIHPELSRNPEVVSRFITEAKAVNQIGNEHIVDIHDFGSTTDGEFYFVMEFLQGEALSDKLKRERVFDPPRALQVAAQVADALAASHSHGIIHRDLKPENIFLINRGANPDFVKVLDFGLAKLTAGEEKASHKTRTGSVMGTPYYMSPEQCEGKANLDHRSDLYSLGVIVFEMMTGKVPFTGEGYGEIIVKHITVAPPRPRAINPKLTRAQEAMLLRALAKDREDRFQSMAEFRMAMLDPERYLVGAPPPVSVTPPPVAVPSSSVSGDLSGKIVFGPPGGMDPDPGHPGRRFSTFGGGGGEMVDEELEVPRSRKGIFSIAAAALLAVGVLVWTQTHSEQDTTEAPPVATAPEPPAPPPPRPAVPESVIIRFESKPEGAAVLHKDSNQILGTTPFPYELKTGKEAVEFVFRKAGFEEMTMRHVPEVPGSVVAVLVPQAPPPPPAVEEAKEKATKPKPPRRTRPARRTAPTRPLDNEDGVLEPNF